jgi:hypothetical protein
LTYITNSPPSFSFLLANGCGTDIPGLSVT